MIQSYVKVCIGYVELGPLNITFGSDHSVSSGPSKLWRFKGLVYIWRPHDISKFCETLVVI